MEDNLHTFLREVMALAAIMGLAGGFAAVTLWVIVEEIVKRRKSS